MSKAMIEEVRATTLVTDEREVKETESNGDQRHGDEELAGEKPKVPEEKESGGRSKDKDVTRAGQSVALSLVAETNGEQLVSLFRHQMARMVRFQDCRPDQQGWRRSSRLWGQRSTRVGPFIYLSRLK